MKKLIIKAGCVLLAFGFSFSVNAQMITQKDTLRMLTYQTQLRNSDEDQWKYIIGLKESFERNILAVQQNQVLVQELRNYCASDTDSYTCSNGSLVTNVDSKMDATVRDWQNAVLIVIEIETSRGVVSETPRFRQRENFNILMNDIDRLNDRANENYNIASLDLIEFQELNPLLFSGN